MTKPRSTEAFLFRIQTSAHKQLKKNSGACKMFRIRDMSHSVNLTLDKNSSMEKPYSPFSEYVALYE